MLEPKSILAAMRADSIPEGECGLWFIKKVHVPKDSITAWEGKLREIPAGNYTKLFRVTLATMHAGGECVMEDGEKELKSHLNFVMNAYGHVLVTGLGLGCITRGLLVNPNVRFVTVIERSKCVLKLVHPYMPTKRLQIIRADALRWCKEARQKFDCAFHDLWTNPDHDEPHLQVWHSHLICAMARKAHVQGAWAFPREHKRLWNEKTPVRLL